MERKDIISFIWTFLFVLTLVAAIGIVMYQISNGVEENKIEKMDNSIHACKVLGLEYLLLSERTFSQDIVSCYNNKTQEVIEIKI